MLLLYMCRGRYLGGLVRVVRRDVEAELVGGALPEPTVWLHGDVEFGQVRLRRKRGGGNGAPFELRDV